MINKVDILLSTFNGDQYLEELLNSILSQSFTSWKLIIRDDESTDKTQDLLNGYIFRYPDKLQVIENPKRNVGVLKSFEILIEHSTAQYIMFCDQDDIWLHRKIEISINKMFEIEQKYNGPVCIYSDLIVTDFKLNVLDNSFFHLQNIATQLESDSYYVTHQNPAAGCTLLFNRKVVERFLPFGAHAIMHDWWIALCCTMNGRLVHIDATTILYRQHSRNTVGAENLKPKNISYYFFDNLRNFFKRWAKIKRYVLQSKEAASICNVDFCLLKYLIKLFFGRFVYSVLSRFNPSYLIKRWSYFKQLTL